MHEEGLSAAQIARVLGVTRTAVCYHLQAEGIRGKQYGYVKEVTPWQDAVLIGTLMGDARLSKGLQHHNAQLKLGHGPKQSAYMLWKKEQLANFFAEDVMPYRYITREGYETFEIRSRSHPLLSTYHARFYPSGVKVVTPEILASIETHEFYAAVMAVWYMDDGSLRGDSASFAVGGLTDNEYNLVFSWFDRAGWSGSVCKGKSNCWTYTFRSSVSLRFTEFVAPYMHKDLMYKLPSSRPRRKMRR
jgi:hypothetical protein